MQICLPWPSCMCFADNWAKDIFQHLPGNHMNKYCIIREKTKSSMPIHNEENNSRDGLIYQQNVTHLWIVKFKVFKWLRKRTFSTDICKTAFVYCRDRVQNTIKQNFGKYVLNNVCKLNQIQRNITKGWISPQKNVTTWDFTTCVFVTDIFRTKDVQVVSEISSNYHHIYIHIYIYKNFSITS